MPPLPLFPLGTVLVPGMVLPLHVFEPRYRALVRDLMSAPEDPIHGREFGIVAIREGHEVGTDAVRALHPVGTTARLQTVQAHDDGRYDIVTVGQRRFAIDVIDASTPYLSAEVRWVDEVAGDSAPVLAPAVAQALVDYRAQLSGVLDEIDPSLLPAEPRALSYAVVAAMVLALPERQRLLESPDDSTRLRQELSLLRRERALAVHLPSVPAGDITPTGLSLN